jgi:O-methyltransferase
MENIDYQEKQQQNHLNGFLKVVDPSFIKYYEKCKVRTMLSTEALYDLWWSVKYLCENEMGGDIVELGVWQGGALEIVAHALNEFKGSNRIVGFDTFEGHPMPEVEEIDIWGNNMQDKFYEVTNSGKKWAFADYDSVEKNLKSIYSNVKLIKGVVNENVDTSDINEISILRLDMDWYEPTKIALKKFYDKIQKGGVLIIDDYGHHSGAKKATDEYVNERKLRINFRHINYSCVAANII